MTFAPEIIAMVAGAGGTALGAVATTLTASRRVDKVDAVAAISKAYESVIEQMRWQLKDHGDQIHQLRIEITRKDAMLERMLERISTIAPIAPIAPVLPVLPVAPIAPIAPVTSTVTRTTTGGN